jgi:hypothetical protein
LTQAVLLRRQFEYGCSPNLSSQVLHLSDIVTELGEWGA